MYFAAFIASTTQNEPQPTPNQPEPSAESISDELKQRALEAWYRMPEDEQFRLYHWLNKWRLSRIK
jgi:hypothetical protein